MASEMLLSTLDKVKRMYEMTSVGDEWYSAQLGPPPVPPGRPDYYGPFNAYDYNPSESSESDDSDSDDSDSEDSEDSRTPPPPFTYRPHGGPCKHCSRPDSGPYEVCSANSAGYSTVWPSGYHPACHAENAKCGRCGDGYRRYNSLYRSVGPLGYHADCISCSDCKCHPPDSAVGFNGKHYSCTPPGERKHAGRFRDYYINQRVDPRTHILVFTKGGPQHIWNSSYNSRRIREIGGPLYGHRFNDYR